MDTVLFFSRAAGTYEDMRAGPHNFVGIIGEKYVFCRIRNKENFYEYYTNQWREHWILILQT